MTTFNKQSKDIPTYDKLGIVRTSGGEVFFGWMFLFTQSSGGSPFSKVGKVVPSFISVAKP